MPEPQTCTKVSFQAVLTTGQESEPITIALDTQRNIESQLRDVKFCAEYLDGQRTQGKESSVTVQDMMDFLVARREAKGKKENKSGKKAKTAKKGKVQKA